MKKILLLVLVALSTQTFAASDRGYFTVVIFSDPHVTQSSGATVEELQGYVRNIVEMGKVGGAKFTFSKAPDGFIPKADLVFCLGDMDPDSEKSGASFKSAIQGLNDANIPFITIAGNHDLVPDYWNGGDLGLTWGPTGGSSCNDVALNLVSNQYETAKKNGLTDASRIAHNTANVVETQPMVFSFNGVRFYVAQTYWFQKPYTRPTLTKAATYWGPDGVIETLEAYVNAHKDEPSVWMQHYPFVAGSDNERWWTDANSSGQVCPIANTTAYDTPKKKKDKLAALIASTKNPYHFSGHTHSTSNTTYTSSTDKTVKVKDYVIAAPFTESNKGAAYIVLMKEGTGVVQVQTVSFADNKIKSRVQPLQEEVYYNILNLDANLYLTLHPNKTEDGAVLGELTKSDGQYFRLIADTTTEGTYHLKTPTRYFLGSRIYYSRSDELAPAADNLFRFTEAGGGGRYQMVVTSNTEGKNLLGLDNLTAGSPTYTNKSTDAHTQWLFIPTTKPVFNEVLQETPKNSTGTQVQCYYIRSLDDGKYCFFNNVTGTYAGVVKTGVLEPENPAYLFYLVNAGNGQRLVYNYATGCAVGKSGNYLNVGGTATPIPVTLNLNESSTAFALITDAQTTPVQTWNNTYGILTIGTKTSHYQFLTADKLPKPTVSIEDVDDDVDVRTENVSSPLIYNLSGQRLTKLQPGLNIQNGKLKFKL